MNSKSGPPEVAVSVALPLSKVNSSFSRRLWHLQASAALQPRRDNACVWPTAQSGVGRVWPIISDNHTYIHFL